MVLRFCAQKTDVVVAKREPEVRAANKETSPPTHPQQAGALLFELDILLIETDTTYSRNQRFASLLTNVGIGAGAYATYRATLTNWHRLPARTKRCQMPCP